MGIELSLKGYHALVCGASAGIGRAAALALASLGAEVTAVARREEQLADLVPDLLAAGAPAARYRVCDLERRDELAGVVEGLIAEHGPVHVLVNNTGGPPSGPLLEADEADFLAPLGRHLFASHLLVKALLPGMVEAGFGRIVNVISLSVREPIVGLGVSNTIRGAMASWSKTLAKELPECVTINNVLPGYTDTGRLRSLGEQLAARGGTTVEAIGEQWIDKVPAARLGRPAELGATIAFLATPAAAYIRGVSLPVDGGRLNGI
ncbi:MAG: SDR family oxidoreductase [Myxococcota bacterium]|jgi:3-oxoacyl-[acyl-carrier protein] reductase|nr:SDR family oxidoreductase [Myxococcota bacterium]